MKKVLLFLLLLNVLNSYADIVPLWDINIGGKVVSAPAVSGGNVYVIADDRYLYCISSEGEIRWKFNVKDWVRDSLTLGPDGTVYVCTGFGNCIAINKEGLEIWRYWFRDEPAGSPTIDFRGNIYIPTKSGKIFNLSHTGRLKWQITLPAAAAGALTLDVSGTLYVITLDERIYALDRYGEILWVFLCAGIPGQVIPVGLSTLITGTDQNTIVALTIEGEFIWNVYFSAPLLSILYENGVIYGIDFSGLLKAVDNQGNILWEKKLNGVPFGGFIITDVINIFCGNGRYYTVSKKGVFLQAYTGSSGFTGAVVSEEGVIYSGNENWHFYAFNSTFPEKEFWIQSGRDASHSSNMLGYNPKNIYPDIPDKFNTFILRSLAVMTSRDIKQSVLNQIEEDFKSGEYFGKEDLYNELLYQLLAEGVLRVETENKRVVNDYPDIRSSSADLLGKYGNLKSISYLLYMLPRETEEYVLRSVIRALGNLQSDPDGEIIDGLILVAARLNTYAMPEKMAREIILCAVKVGRYSANYNKTGELIVQLYSSNINASLKEDALQVMQTIRK